MTVKRSALVVVPQPLRISDPASTISRIPCFRGHLSVQNNYLKIVTRLTWDLQWQNGKETELGVQRARVQNPVSDGNYPHHPSISALSRGGEFNPYGTKTPPPSSLPPPTVCYRFAHVRESLAADIRCVATINVSKRTADEVVEGWVARLCCSWLPFGNSNPNFSWEKS